MFDEKKFVESVRDIAKTEHLYVYEKPIGDDSCLYQQDGEPSCLIGHALFDVGVSIDDLRKFDVADVVDDSGAYSVLKYLGASDYVAEWAECVQGRQDCGVPWGEAVEVADEFMEDSE